MRLTYIYAYAAFLCISSVSAAAVNSTLTYDHVPPATWATKSSTAWSDSTTAWRWTWRDQLGIVISGLVAVLTAPGGGSGATLYMPLFNLLIGFDARQTAVITNFVVFLGAITSTMYAVAEPHPVNPNRPRIDWCSVLVMTPPLMLGVSFGVILNSVIPVWLLQSATLAAFAWSLSKVLISFLRINKVESKTKAAAKGSADAASSAPAKTAAASSESCKAPTTAGSSSKKLGKLHLLCAAARARIAAWWAVQPVAVQGLVLLIMAVHMTFAVVSHASTTKCSKLFWILLACNAGLMVLLTWQAVLTTRWHSKKWPMQQPSPQPRACSIIDPPQLAAAHSDLLLQVVVDQDAGEAQFADIELGMDATREHSIVIVNPTGESHSVVVSVLPKSVTGAAAATAAAAAAAAMQNYGPSWEAIQWNVRKLSYMPLLMVLVGVVSGCLGLGGGFLVTPMLLGMGLHPQCQAVTSRVILFISTFATSLLYLISGRVPLYYGLLHGGINLVLSPVGIWIMDRVIEKTGRPSLMVLLNIGRYAVGVSLLFALSAVPTYIATAKGELHVGFALQNFCGHDAL